MFAAWKPFAAQRRELTDSLCLFLAGWMFFLVQVQYPTTRNFDEFHYIPSALQWLKLTQNQNWEHPPLAKLLIAVGVGIFGDNPLGWRFMSTLFGALTLVGMYHLGLALFRNRPQALWVAGITVLNQLLYVQSRIAMLDTFMMAFLVWSLAFLVRALQEPEGNDRRWMQASGVLMGLAIACKWFSIVAFGMAMGLFGIQALLRRSPGKLADSVVHFGLPALIAYYATFVPYFFVDQQPPFTLKDLLVDAQTRMLDGQKRVVTDHPYNSQWWQWPILQRPIWYAFDRIDGGWVRGVLLLGNPAIMFGGLLAVLACLIDFFRRRSWVPFLILSFYGAFTLCWVAIPRKINFYYYYFPAGMMLSLAIVHALFLVRRPVFRFAFLGIATGLFIYFFPILSAMKFKGDEFGRWMWFRSWI